MLSRIGLGLLAVTSLILVSCGSTSDTQSSTTLYCYASASEVSSGGNTVNVSLNCSGGTAPYTASNFLIGSTTPSSVSGTTSNFTGSVAVVLTDTTRTSFNGLTGTILVTDYGASDSDSDTTALTSTVTFTVGSTTGTTTSNGCTITPSTSAPAIGQSVTFTFTANLGTSPYTFSSFSPGTYGTTTSGPNYVSATQSTATATYSTAGTQTPIVYVTDATGTQRSCSTTVTVGGTSTGSTGCSVQLSATAIYHGQSIYAIVTPYNASNYFWQVQFPAAAYVGGAFLGNNTVRLDFPVAYGSVPLNFLIRDAYGVSQGYCSASVYVY